MEGWILFPDLPWFGSLLSSSAILAHGVQPFFLSFPTNYPHINIIVRQKAAFFEFYLKSLQMVTAVMKLKDAYSLKGKL